jgi:hypothetical protein
MLKRFLFLASFIGVVVFSPQVFARVVPCPGNDSDSSAAIQSALNSASPGETIQLEAGTYYLYKPVQVSTAFKGALKGAGMDKTIISIHPDHPIEAINLPSFDGPENLGSVLFQFNIPLGLTGDVSVTDLSMIVTQANPCQADYLSNHDLWEFVMINGDTVNTRFERLRIRGGPGNTWGEYNNNVGIILWPYIYPTDTTVFMKGDHILKDCEFESMPIGYYATQIRDGKITLSDNKFKDVRHGIAGEAFSHCTGEITRNQISAHGDGVNWGSGSGIWIFAGTWLTNPDLTNPDWIYVLAPVPSKFSITNNKVEATQWANGIVLTDYDVSATYTTVKLLSGSFISQNKVTGKMTWCAIGTDCNWDLSVTNNELRGDGAFGIADFGDGANWLIKGNNVQKFSTMDNPWPPIAPIFLEPFTTGCTVVGGSVKDNVTDLGTGNILVGVNNMGGNPPGPSIRTSMKNRVDLKSMLRKP